MGSFDPTGATNQADYLTGGDSISNFYINFGLVHITCVYAPSMIDQGGIPPYCKRTGEHNYAIGGRKYFGSRTPKNIQAGMKIGIRAPVV
jgi:hypothetical protein